MRLSERRIVSIVKDYLRTCASVFSPVPRLLLSIAAELSEPPSSPSVFRDVTLYASVIRHYEVVATAPRAMIDDYARWFRRYGLFDFVSELLPPAQIRADEVAVEIEGGVDARLTAHSLGAVLALL